MSAPKMQKKAVATKDATTVAAEVAVEVVAVAAVIVVPGKAAVLAEVPAADAKEANSIQRTKRISLPSIIFESRIRFCA